MSVSDTWRSARLRTNLVRAFGYVVGLVVGLPLALFALCFLFFGGIVDVVSGPLDPLDGLFALSWGIGALGGWGMGLRALQDMPRIDARERRRTVFWLLAGCAAVSPLAIMPSVLGAAGLALLAAGIVLVVELLIEDVEERRGDRAT